MAKKNVSEFTRLRDIARKRNVRLVEQGLTAPIEFPKMRDIKNDPERVQKELEKLRRYVGQSATVRNVKKSGTGFFNPEFGLPDFDLLPKRNKKRKELTPAQRARKNERARERYIDKIVKELGKHRFLKSGHNKAKIYAGYIKALRLFLKRWQNADIGVKDLGFDPEQLALNPDLARAFVEYIDYRYSINDFKGFYIEEHIKDFGRELQQRFEGKQLSNDFREFLKDREQLWNNAKNMQGFSSSVVRNALKLW